MTANHSRGFIDGNRPGGSGADPCETATIVDPDGAPCGLPVVARFVGRALALVATIAALALAGCGSAALQWCDATSAPRSADLPERDAEVGPVPALAQAPQRVSYAGGYIARLEADCRQRSRIAVPVPGNHGRTTRRFADVDHTEQLEQRFRECLGGGGR